LNAQFVLFAYSISIQGLSSKICHQTVPSKKIPVAANYSQDLLRMVNWLLQKRVSKKSKDKECAAVAVLTFAENQLIELFCSYLFAPNAHCRQETDQRAVRFFWAVPARVG
jgi:hypothetical protein